MIEKISKDELKSNLLSPKHWQRLIYMLLFAVLLYVASITVWVLVALQFLFALITGRDNANLRSLGGSISTYIYQALQFLTYSSEQKPFPFSDWPSAPSEKAEKDTTEPEQITEEGQK